jgi:phosphatidylinositol glycan class Z
MIRTDKVMQQRSSFLASTVLGIVAVFGVFNRITFPAFLLIPGIRLLPYYAKKQARYSNPWQDASAD